MGPNNNAVFVGEGLDESTPIFRYMPLERYYELIEGNYNTLTHLSCWEDPYEAFVYRGGLASYGEDEMQIYAAFKSVYGQSWTLFGEEKEIFWRAMRNGKDVVRIRTTIGKLIASLGSRSEDSNAHVRIAKVQYLPQGEVDAQLIRRNLHRAVTGNVAEKMDFLFVKRNEFNDEQEVRIIAIPETQEIERDPCSKGHLLKLQIAPADFVEEVLLDPRMSRRDREQLICRTQHVSTNIDVVPSGLFDWPEIVEEMPNGLCVDIPERDLLKRQIAHLGEDTQKSILSRVGRVLKAVRYTRPTRPTETEFLSMIRDISQYVLNRDSANSCRKAMRLYMTAVYGHDDRSNR